MEQVELDPSEITFAELEARLGPPNSREPLGEATLFRWMLSGEPAYFLASFLLFGRDIRPTDIPSTMILNGPPLTSATNVKLAEIAPGDSEQFVERMFEVRAIKPLPGHKRFQWDLDRVVQWAAVKDKISMVMCVNEGLVRRTWDERNRGKEASSDETNMP